MQYLSDWIPTGDAIIEPEESQIHVADCDKFLLFNVYTLNTGAEFISLQFRHKI
jgi:hypothetical protein